MNQINEIKVSVCVVTYNQEKYLAECLESLVQQETNFNFEIIVGEDCSTDGTRAIVKSYAEKYPHLVIPLLHENNVGALENIKQVYLKARGKYIAHVDGDDAALPNKLQKQFNALESNGDCTICSHNVLNIDGNSAQLNYQNWKHNGGIYTLFDLFHRMPFFAHSSKMFRNNLSENELNVFSNPEILDMDLHFVNLQHGNIVHLDENLGQYRMNVGMSNVGKKANPLLAKGAERIFEKGLEFYQNDSEKIKKLKSLYAYAMLQCAYNYAVYDQDPQLFKKYVNKSFDQKFIGVKQVIFKIATYAPTLFFKIFSLRSQLRNK